MLRAPSPLATRRVYTRRILALLAVLFLIAFLLHASRSYRIIQAYDGEWHLTQVIVLGRRGSPIKTRWYVTGRNKFGNQLYIRQEWDWEGDGVYDCREDILELVPGSVMRVYYPRQGEWIPAPAEVRCQKPSR